MVLYRAIWPGIPFSGAGLEFLIIRHADFSRIQGMGADLFGLMNFRATMLYCRDRKNDVSAN